MTRSLFIAPHLDDVVFSCGGLVARASAAGERPLLLTVFAGAPASTTGLAPLDRLHALWGMAGLLPKEVVERRRAEDRAAAQVLGAECRFLEHCDAIYRSARYGARDALFGPPLAEDAARVVAIGDELVTLWRSLGEPRVYLPLGLGGHVDHRIVASAATPLCASGAEVWGYEDFPYARTAGPEALPQDRSAAQVIDVSATMSLRLEAMACYQSQLQAIFKDERYDEVTRAYAAATGLPGGAYGERVWRKNKTPPTSRSKGS